MASPFEALLLKKNGRDLENTKYADSQTTIKSLIAKFNRAWTINNFFSRALPSEESAKVQ